MGSYHREQDWGCWEEWNGGGGKANLRVQYWVGYQPGELGLNLPGCLLRNCVGSASGSSTWNRRRKLFIHQLPFPPWPKVASEGVNFLVFPGWSIYLQNLDLLVALRLLGCLLELHGSIRRSSSEHPRLDLYSFMPLLCSKYRIKKR